MTNLFSRLLNFILPPRCLLCGKEVATDDCLCTDCFNNINFISRPYCEHCGRPFISPLEAGNACVDCLQHHYPFRLARAAVEYNEHSKKLILDFKFYDRIENKKLLARWLFLAGKDIFEAGIDVILPIPLHFTRLLKRKYNQSAILCAELQKLCQIPVNYKALKKIKRTVPQVRCSQKQRLVNVRHAFCVNHPEAIKGKRVLLVDDVFTTGSTMKECTEVLLKAGAASVDALTIARVLK